MARPKILRGTYVNVLMGDGGGPEVFDPICGLTAKSFTHQVNTNDNAVRDCADPEDVPARELVATSEQWDLSGSGLLNRSQLDDVRQAVGVLKNYRYELGEPTTDEVFQGYWYGPGMLTNLTITGDDGDFVQVEMTIASSGEWDFEEVIP